MPKYFSFKVCGYYLYFTSKCILEAMHVHASDSKLTEEYSAKFFVKGNGDSVLQERGCLNDREVNKIPKIITKLCMKTGRNIANKDFTSENNR